MALSEARKSFRLERIDQRLAQLVKRKLDLGGDDRRAVMQMIDRELDARNETREQ